MTVFIPHPFSSLPRKAFDMPRPARQDFQIYVYRPNGWLLTKFTESATSFKVAVARAKKRIYQQGRLAHFYTFVSKSIS